MSLFKHLLCSLCFIVNKILTHVISMSFSFHFLPIKKTSQHFRNSVCNNNNCVIIIIIIYHGINNCGLKMKQKGPIIISCVTSTLFTDYWHDLQYGLMLCNPKQ